MNDIKPLTIKETSLKEEMKSRCLNKGQYTDKNAEEKFKMLCHLEDFEIGYWELQQRNIIMEKYLELIHDIGFDYDGLNTVDSLKGLVDELCRFASLGRVCNLTEPIYENNGARYNILHQELEEGNNK